MSHCIQKSDKTIIVKEEKSSSIRIYNPERVELELCDVDGGLIDDKSRRCDKSVRRVGEWVAFIELKGRNVEAATEQLYDTFSHEGIARKLEKKRVAIVVSKVVRVPKFDSYLKNQKQRFLKAHRSLYRIERSGCDLCLDDVFKIGR